MSTAKINIKNIDYFKYRRLVIDANRDDYAACSREVKSLCDAATTTRRAVEKSSRSVTPRRLRGVQSRSQVTL